MYRNVSRDMLDSIIVLVGDSLSGFPPAQYLLLLTRMCADYLVDRMTLVIVSFLLGMLFLLAAELFLFWRYFSKAAILPPPKFEDTPTQLPEVLKSRLEHSSLKQKEDCIWLNFLLQFLFSELRDSLQLRRFLTKKIQLEFEEVLRSRTGVLVDELFLRDFHLGDNFPVVMGMSVEKSDVSNGVIQTLNLKTRIAYDGGFQIAIDAALPFQRMAYVSVTVLKLRGVVRLQFTQLPFSHWNMAFIEEPDLEVDVTAQLDGRPMPKLRNIIANQIRKIIRKKHTLPMYKMRFKPFFQPRLDPGQARDARIHISGAELGNGILEVTVIEASRLPFVLKGSKLYCSVSVDELPWKDQMMKERRNRKVMTVELVRNSSDQSLGMMVKDELLPDRLHPIVMIGEVNLGSPAHIAGIQQADILVGIGGNKVTSAKQAMKNLKWAKDRIQLQIERAEMVQTTSTKDTALLLSRRVNSWHDGQSEKSADTDVTPNWSTPSPSSTNSPKTGTKQQHQQFIPEGKRTTFVEASENPEWNHKFLFTVDSSTSYLNLCLWIKGGDRSGQPEMISSTKQDVLLGYVSLNLDEIYLHCLITLNGTMQDKIKLKHGHYKTEDELIKTWSVHKGWDLNQMYGDISLSFHYVPKNLTAEQRHVLSGSKAASVKLQSELFQRYKTHENEQSKPSPTKIAEALKSKDLNEGHHQFGTTTFMTAIFCDYCGKKIWMKEAFKCQTCDMVCHKKCLVKCLVNTICTDDGAKKRNSIDEPWEPLTATGKLKHTVVTDEALRNYAFQDDDFSINDGLTTNDANMNTSESTQSMTNLTDVVNNDPELKALTSLQKEEIVQEVNPVTDHTLQVNPVARFRGLKEQTDRMKDRVLKHLRRNNVPAAFNDRAIMAAKETGARLFIDMEPSMRKDKLEELVKKLDQELKAEMENKELIEQDLSVLETAEQKVASSKRKSEMRSLNNKILRSVEKQDAMRLLMLQYCSGLQNCINSLEAEVNIISSRSEFIDGQQISQIDLEPPKVSRSAAVGGFVRRASSSVKEKMSFIKKDFGKKGAKSGDDERASTSKSGDDDRVQTSKSGEDDRASTSKSGEDDRASTKWREDNKPSTTVKGKNNSGLNVIEDIEDMPSQANLLETDLSDRSKSNHEMLLEDLIEEIEDMPSQANLLEADLSDRSKSNHEMLLKDLTDSSDLKTNKQVSDMTEMTTQMSNIPQTASLPSIEVCVEEVDVVATATNVHDYNQSRMISPQEVDAGIPRSISDSRLEINKMLSLRPEDILRYHGTSLPRLSVIDDSDSESDYLVIESVITDTSDSDNETSNVSFKGGHKTADNDDSDDGRGQHRNTVQLQTFQV